MWRTLLFYPFLNVLLVLYAILGDNLGWAVIALAIIIRILLIPSTRTQMAMTKKMADMRPALAEAQKKFKNDQEKLAKEQMRLYKEYGYNPIGCLGTFLPQILILAAIIGVIRTITAGDFNGVYSFVKEFVFKGGEMKLNTHFYLWDLAQNYSAIAKDEGSLSFKALPYLVLSLAVGLVQYISTKLTQAIQTPPPAQVKSNPDDPMSQEEMQAQMMKSMNTIFPIMTAFFTLSAPAVLGLYWFVQAIMMIIQFFVLNRDKSLEAFGFKKDLKKSEDTDKSKVVEGELITEDKPENKSIEVSGGGKSESKGKQKSKSKKKKRKKK